MKLAKTAMKMNGTRIASGTSGNSLASLIQRPPTLANSCGATTAAGARVGSRMSTIFHLFGEANAWVDVGVEDVDDQVDRDDHDPGQQHDPLHQGKIPLEDPFVKQPADPRPSKDHLDDYRRVDHDHEVDTSQSQHWDQRILEGVHRDYRYAGQPLQPRKLDVLAAQHLEHARARQTQQRRCKVPTQCQ